MSYVCLSDHLPDSDLLFFTCNVYESTSSSTHIWGVFSQAHKSRIDELTVRVTVGTTQVLRCCTRFPRKKKSFQSFRESNPNSVDPSFSSGDFFHESFPLMNWNGFSKTSTVTNDFLKHQQDRVKDFSPANPPIRYDPIFSFLPGDLMGWMKCSPSTPNPPRILENMSSSCKPTVSSR